MALPSAQTKLQYIKNQALIVVESKIYVSKIDYNEFFSDI